MAQGNRLGFASVTDGIFLWFVTRGTGVVLVGLITLSTAAGVLSTMRTRNTRWTRFATQSLHRSVSLFSVALLLVHVTSSVLHRYGKIQIGLLDVLIPFRGTWEPFWVGLGSIAFDLMLLVTITSHIRHRLNHRQWRIIHLLSYATWMLGLAHGLGIGTDSTTSWAMTVTLLSVAVFVGCVKVRMDTVARERMRATRVAGSTTERDLSTRATRSAS